MYNTLYRNIFRYTVALKNSIHGANQDAICEEAKSMIQIEDYHDHIVNLQGIIIKPHGTDGGHPDVI